METPTKKNILEAIFNFFAKKNLVIFCLTSIVVLLIWLLSQQCSSKKTSNQQETQNEAALKKELTIEKNKKGELQASVVAYEGKMNDLNKYSTDLEQEVKNLKNRKPEVIIKTQLVYVGDTAKTTTQIESEGNGNYELLWSYTSKDSSRIIEGNTQLNAKAIIDYARKSYVLDIHPSITEITRDIKKFDLVVGVAKNKKTGLDEIFVTPKDREVSIGKIEGAVLPKGKKKRWAVGFYAGYGVAYNKQKLIPGITIGFGISRSLFTF